MKTNDEYLKDLYCNVLIKSMSGASVEIAIKDAEFAIKSFCDQFSSKEILKPIDDKIIKVYNPMQETGILTSLVRMRNFRFKGCTIYYSINFIPSEKLGGFPYWLIIDSENGTMQIETKNPN